MNNNDFNKLIIEIQNYKNRIHSITFQIEEMDEDFVYLIHNTSINAKDTLDVYKNGIAYSGNEIWRTFKNLSKNWMGKNIFKEQADKTSLEQVVFDSCSISYQCFIYKIPLSFFEPVKNSFYPIPIWYVDKTYIPKFNISSSEVKYDVNSKESVYFRMFPSLLLGHYDIRTNEFYRNPNYSCVFDNSNGIYDKRQLIYFDKYAQYENLWQHNDYVLNEKNSPYKEKIRKIIEEFKEELDRRRNK